MPPPIRKKADSGTTLPVITVLRECYRPRCQVGCRYTHGGQGNIAGGLPLGRLCAGTNVNDITCRAIQTGEYLASITKKRLCTRPFWKTSMYSGYVRLREAWSISPERHDSNSDFALVLV